METTAEDLEEAEALLAEVHLSDGAASPPPSRRTSPRSAATRALSPSDLPSPPLSSSDLPSPPSAVSPVGEAEHMEEVLRRCKLLDDQIGKPKYVEQHRHPECEALLQLIEQKRALKKGLEYHAKSGSGVVDQKRRELQILEDRLHQSIARLVLANLPREQPRKSSRSVQGRWR